MKKVEVQTILENTLNKIKILDIHTHLFPPQHENYYLSGLVDTLNYHYLIAELFVSTNINIEKFTPGIYSVDLMFLDGSFATKKIIKY